MTDGPALAEALRKPVVGIGGGFMISPEAKAAGKEGGYRGWAFYMGGRAGVLGPAPAVVVSAALGFFEAEMVRTNWERALAVRPVEETVQRYVATCRLWGRNRYTGLDGVERLADLLDSVVQGAEPAGLPLFAGWRALPLPDDAPARVAQSLQVLREHRGGAHVMGVRAAGLSPLEAVLAGDEGPPNARFFGWPEPYPEIDDGVRKRRAQAEWLTTATVAPAYACLTDPQAAELVALVDEAERQVREAAA